MYFSSTNFAPNLYISLPNDRILPNFGKVLENNWSLQNYEGFLVDGLENELCALETRKLQKNVSKY